MSIARPIADSYVVPGTRLVAGEYPGRPAGTPAGELAARLGRFLDAGITAFVDLTDEEELSPYGPALHGLARTRGIDVTHDRMPITDMDVCAPDYMRAVLDLVDRRLGEGRAVYVHCWGGVGRTGMTVGCWLVRHGMTGDAALREVARLFATMSPEKTRRHRAWGSPQTDPQRDVVRRWREAPLR